LWERLINKVTFYFRQKSDQSACRQLQCLHKTIGNLTD
jgi:hypothetical protein